MIIKAISFILFAMATGMVNAAELEDRINAMLEDVKGGLQATEIMETPKDDAHWSN